MVFWQKVIVDYCLGALVVVWISHFERKALVYLGLDVDTEMNRKLFFPWQSCMFNVTNSRAEILKLAAKVLSEYGAVVVKLDESELVKAVTPHSWRGFGKKITVSATDTSPCTVFLEIAPRMPGLLLILLPRLVTDYGTGWKHMRALETKMTTGIFPVALSANGIRTAEWAAVVDRPAVWGMAGTWQRMSRQIGILLLLCAISFDGESLWPQKQYWAVLAAGIYLELFVYIKFRLQAKNKLSTAFQESFEFVLYNFWIVLVLVVVLLKPLQNWDAGQNISFFIWVGVVTLLTVVGLRDMKSEREQRILASTLRENTELERQLSEAKLVALSAQIEPHFLFNTLASIQYLIRNDANKAGEMTSDLIRYLRLALPRMKQSTARLADELDLVRAYLGIMQIRMGARLQFAIDSPDDLGDVQIPTMTLITLVENAIKHGLEQKPDGGMINLTVDRDIKDQRNLRLEIADTGGGFSTAASGTGIGLANIRERLNTLYGSRAQLELEANQPSGVKAILIVPIERK
jgi:two-component sensor histidine kinase